MWQSIANAWTPASPGDSLHSMQVLQPECDGVQTLPPLEKLRQPLARIPPANREPRQLRLGREGDINEGLERNRYMQEQVRRPHNCGPPGEALKLCGLGAVAAALANLSFGEQPQFEDTPPARPEIAGPAAEVWILPMSSRQSGARRLTYEAECMINDRKEQIRAVSDMIFDYLDRDNDHFLNRKEMSRLALITTGAQPPEQEWLALCRDVGANYHCGLLRDHFFKVVVRAPDDESLDDLLRMVRAADRDPHLCSPRLSRMDPAALRPDVSSFGDREATPEPGYRSVMPHMKGH